MGVTRQEALFRRALTERGLPQQGVRIDHVNGTCEANGHRYGIIYPDSAFGAFGPRPKRLRFYFRGDMHGTGGRRALLAPFVGPDASISESSWGRKMQTKSIFDARYMDALAAAEFGLCPHHTDWKGPRSTMWTYRFVDCVLVGAIPVLFRAAPLSAVFTEGFHVVWEDGPFTYDPAHAAHNRTLAETRFRLP